MKKSRSNTFGKASDDLTDAQLLQQYQESAFDALLYWTNATTTTLGANTTLTILTEMMAAAIENLVPPDQKNRAEDVIMAAIEEAFANISDDAPASNEKKSSLN